MWNVGNLVEFEYNGKLRRVRINNVKMGYSFLLGYIPNLITGWDYTADAPIGGFRSFSLSNVKYATLLRG